MDERSENINECPPEVSLDGKNETPGNLIAIRFENLTRKFGNFIAVDNINLDVPRGSFFGFLGPNGAGKSTTINMLIGLIKPTKGRIFIEGMDINTQPVEVKRILGIVPENLNLYDRLKCREFLQFSAALYGLKKKEAIGRTEEVLVFLELDGNKIVADLSQGMKKKLSLAAALLHNPRILILDEPFISVDAISSSKIKDVLSRMVEKGVTIFMTSHVLEVVERMCTQVAIIDHGKILLQGSMEEMLKDTDSSGRHTLEEVFVAALGADGLVGELSWLS